MGCGGNREGLCCLKRSNEWGPSLSLSCMPATCTPTISAILCHPLTLPFPSKISLSSFLLPLTPPFMILPSITTLSASSKLLCYIYFHFVLGSTPACICPCTPLFQIHHYTAFIHSLLLHTHTTKPPMLFNSCSRLV